MKIDTDDANNWTNTAYQIIGYADDIRFDDPDALRIKNLAWQIHGDILDLIAMLDHYDNADDETDTDADYYGD